MAEKMKDGGPAFPIQSAPFAQMPGMSLRDYAEVAFTAAWIQSLGMRHNEARLHRYRSDGRSAPTRRRAGRRHARSAGGVPWLIPPSHVMEKALTDAMEGR